MVSNGAYVYPCARTVEEHDGGARNKLHRDHDALHAWCV